ncbi:MAG: hypothetical protein ACTHOU_00100 [Aureliella sp.]
MRKLRLASFTLMLSSGRVPLALGPRSSLRAAAPERTPLVTAVARFWGLGFNAGYHARVPSHSPAAPARFAKFLQPSDPLQHAWPAELAPMQIAPMQVAPAHIAPTDFAPGAPLPAVPGPTPAQSLPTEESPPAQKSPAPEPVRAEPVGTSAAEGAPADAKAKASSRGAWLRGLLQAEASPPAAADAEASLIRSPSDRGPGSPPAAAPDR